LTTTAPYLHYSFDLWLTLIRSNPAFKEQRARYFQQQYNRRQKSEAEIQAIFREVDLMCNAINEKTGGNIAAEEMYLMVISRINEDPQAVFDTDVAALYAQMELLLLEHMPVVYCSNTISALSRLRAAGDCSISLLSNTGFIKGPTLRKVLQALQLDTYLDFQLYSDEAGLSKPNPDFFRLMLDTLEQQRPRIDPSRIIHIGDNPNADIAGAKAAGIHSLLVNSNELTILNLLN
jgi:putative hydrolase of the HAD superfamily